MMARICDSRCISGAPIGLQANITMSTLVQFQLGGNKPQCFPQVTLVQFFDQHVLNLRREKPKNARMLR